MTRYSVMCWNDTIGEWEAYADTNSIINACVFYDEAMEQFPMVELVDNHTAEILECNYGDEGKKISMVNICTEEIHAFPDKGSDDANMTYIVKEILEPADLFPNPYWADEWKRYRSMRLRGQENYNHVGILTLGLDGLFVFGEYWCK